MLAGQANPHPRLNEVPVFDRPRATSQVPTTRRDNIIACRAESGSSWFWILFFGERYGLFRVLLADQVHSCLIQLGAHLITLVGARDVTDVTRSLLYAKECFSECKGGAAMRF